MSTELIAILGVGAALAGVAVSLAALMFHILRRMEERIRQDAQRSEERTREDIGRSEERNRQDIRGSEERTRQEIRGVEERMESRFASQDARFTSHDGRFTVLETRISDIGERTARIEGLLEGIRDTITGREAA